LARYSYRWIIAFQEYRSQGHGYGWLLSRLPSVPAQNDAAFF
jgi:hypothetical protein